MRRNRTETELVGAGQAVVVRIYGEFHRCRRIGVVLAVVAVGPEGLRERGKAIHRLGQVELRPEAGNRVVAADVHRIGLQGLAQVQRSERLDGAGREQAAGLRGAEPVVEILCRTAIPDDVLEVALRRHIDDARLRRHVGGIEQKLDADAPAVEAAGLRGRKNRQ